MEEEKKMEVDDPEVISLNDESTSSSCSNCEDTSQLEPTTPKAADKSSKLDSSTLSASKASLTKSHEKMDKHLKLQIKLENEKKRLEEKEKKEREKKEREEKRLKREEELKKKRQEEEELKKKRQQEREKQAQEKAEREKKLAEEKAEREKKRLEQLNAKNEEKKKKEEERKQKEEERKQKEEEKKKQDEEKKKQEEEKQKEEDEKRRKEEKIKSHFVNYFIKKDPPTFSCNGEKSTTRFMPFQPKQNMYIAPLCRRQDVLTMTEEEHEDYIRTLDEAIFNNENKQKNGKLYLDEIKENKHLIRKQVKSYRKNTLPVEKCTSDENSNDVLEVKLCDVASIQTKFKVKFLLFDPKHYRRPPYYGTWRKKSKSVNGRRPFAKDEKQFNYEIDSDDEWEDEPADAESIADSDKGDEEDEMADDEDDDGFFVPHGHLSDDELDEEDRLLDADTKKAREDAKNQIWETERKKGYKVLIPKSYFVPIYSNSTEKIIKLKNDEIKFLEQYQIVPIATSLPITINNEVVNKANAAAAGAAAPSDETVPKSASKPPKASKPKQIANANQSINSQTPNSPQVLSTSVTNSPNSTPSIIKFISKVSKKNIICNLEQINPPSATSTTATVDTPNKLTLLNSPSQVSKIPIHAQNTPSSCQMNLSAVTPSPRVNPTNSNTAEKRSCSVSSSDSCVKRLKLDDTTQDRQNDSTTTNSPISSKRSQNEHKTTNSPNIMSLFKKNELKKAVALNAIEKHENTSATVETSTDKEATSKNSDDQNNKENTKASLIVID